MYILITYRILFPHRLNYFKLVNCSPAYRDNQITYFCFLSVNKSINKCIFALYTYALYLVVENMLQVTSWILKKVEMMELNGLPWLNKEE